MSVMEFVNKINHMSEEERNTLYNHYNDRALKDMIYVSIDLKKPLSNEDVAIKYRGKNSDNKRVPMFVNKELFIREGFDVIHKGFYNSASHLVSLFVSPTLAKLTEDKLLSDYIKDVKGDKSYALRLSYISQSNNKSGEWLTRKSSIDKKNPESHYNNLQKFYEDNFPSQTEWLLSEERDGIHSSISKYLTENLETISNFVLAYALENTALKQKELSTFRVVINFRNYNYSWEKEEGFSKLLRVYDSKYANYLYVDEKPFFVPSTTVSNMDSRVSYANWNSNFKFQSILPISLLDSYYLFKRYIEFLYDTRGGIGIQTFYWDKHTLKVKPFESLDYGDYIVNIYDINKGTIGIHSVEVYKSKLQPEYLSYKKVVSNEMLEDVVDMNSTEFLRLLSKNFLDGVFYKPDEFLYSSNYLDFEGNRNTKSLKLRGLYQSYWESIVENLPITGVYDTTTKENVLNLIRKSFNYQVLEPRKQYSMLNKLLLVKAIENKLRGTESMDFKEIEASLRERLDSEEDLTIESMDEYLIIVGNIFKYQMNSTKKQESQKSNYRSTLSRKTNVNGINSYINQLDSVLSSTIIPNKKYKKARVAAMVFNGGNKVKSLDALWFSIYSRGNILYKTV